jgi:hypothetical protein
MLKAATGVACGKDSVRVVRIPTEMASPVGKLRLATMLVGGQLLVLGLVGCGAPAPEAVPPEQVQAPEQPGDGMPSPAVTPSPGSSLERTATSRIPVPLTIGPAPEGGHTAADSTPSVARAASTPDPGPAIRTYLAEHFIYSSWYTSVRSVEALGHGVDVALSPGVDGIATARDICRVILKSGYVAQVVVRASATISATCR